MYDGGAMCKVFGSGLAFPTRTNDGRLVPEAGVQNPRADSFSLYLNYVGNKILDSILPKSKLNSKNHYIYTDKILKKRRKDEENKRKNQTAIYNVLVNGTLESNAKNGKNSRKLVKKNEITKKNVYNKVLSVNPAKTPVKKSFPSKIRDQVNSCKKSETRKLVGSKEDY